MTSNGLTPRTDLRLKRLAYYEKGGTAAVDRRNENEAGEELRKSMIRDVRVRPKTAVTERGASSAFSRNAAPAQEKQNVAKNRRPVSTTPSGFSKSPRIKSTEYSSTDCRLHQYSDVRNSTPGVGSSADSRRRTFPEHDRRKPDVQVNSWLKTDKRKSDTAKSQNDTLRKAQNLEGRSSKNKPLESPRNSFSSFLEAQYEEDYSVLALTEDIKRSGSHGFFLEDNNSSWNDNETGQPRTESKHVLEERRPRSRENLLRESLEQVVKEEAKLKGHSEPDREHVDTRVSAMFEKLDATNLEAILGKERYERLIKNFEESEELVDGVSSGTGTGWLKESSDDSQLETFRSNPYPDELMTNSSHNMRSDSHGMRNIQIDISEPYKSEGSDGQPAHLGSTVGSKKTSVYDFIMEDDLRRSHPLSDLAHPGHDYLNDLPVVPAPTPEWNESEKVGKEASYKGGHHRGQYSEKRDTEEMDSDEEVSQKSLKDFDKRFTKSGLLSTDHKTDSQEEVDLVDRPPTGHLRNSSDRGFRPADSDKNRGLLAKASLDTDTDFHRSTLRRTFESSHGPEPSLNDSKGRPAFPPVSYLTPEDHVEAIKQHVEIRKRERDEISGLPTTNPALERYFSSVENLVVHKDGNESIISGEGFEPVPEPDIVDTPGGGLARAGKSAAERDKRPVTAMRNKNKAAPRPSPRRRNQDLALASSRSNKKSESITERSSRSSARPSSKNKNLKASHDTEVRLSSSEYALEPAQARRTGREEFTAQQSQLLRGVLKEFDVATGDNTTVWDDLDDDDLLTRVTSIVEAPGADGALTERIKNLNIGLGVLRAERTGNSVVQNPTERKHTANRSTELLDPEAPASRTKENSRIVEQDLNNDLDTCVETDLGTDLGTDFVNVFFQKKRDLKSKQETQEQEILKSVANYAFPVATGMDSEDDFTLVSALKPVHRAPEKPKEKDHLNVRKGGYGKTSPGLDEETDFNEEFEVNKSSPGGGFESSTSRTAQTFFEEVDTKFRSSVKESDDFQEKRSQQQMVKACPECGEVNKVYVTWCVECGGVLSEVKPVPFMPRKSHTPREVNRPDPSSVRNTAAQESFKIKLESSFNNEPFKDKQVSNGLRGSEDQSSGVRDSDNFEYEPMQSPVRSLPGALQRALSLDLRTSTDSSAVASSGATGAVSGAPGAAVGRASPLSTRKSSRKKPGTHNDLARLSENMDFVYNEAESPKKSYPHALQKELLLELSADSDSTAVNNVIQAAREVEERQRLESLHESAKEESDYNRYEGAKPPGRVDVGVEVRVEPEETVRQDDSGGPSMGSADPLHNFLSPMRQDPRLLMAGGARPSSAVPQHSRSRGRPGSAAAPRPRPSTASAKNKARSPVVSPQYERKWASSSLSWSSTTRSGDLRASSSLGLRSATRPASAKVTRPSSALSRSLVSGGDVGSNKGKLRPQSAASKPRFADGGDFGIVGKSAEQDEDALNTGRTALLTVTPAVPPKRKGVRQRNVFDTYTKYIAMKDNPEDFQSPRIARGEYSAWLCLPDELWLMIMEYLSHKELSSVAQTCSQLNRIAMDDALWRTIVINKSHAINDDWLIHIGRREPNSISFLQCHGDRVTPHGMRELFRQCSESLNELRFSGCVRGQLTGDNIVLHAASRCRHITRLDASWTNVNDNGVTAISDACDRLEAVNFSGCQTLTDEAVNSLLLKHGIYLREVELFGCFNLTAKTATALANHCKGLMTLNLGQVWKLSDTSIAQLSGSLGLIETLNISGCKQMKDTGIHRIVRNCPKLKSLALANCPNITDTSMGEVATYCSHVRSLDVSGCKNVGNNGVRMLAMACQQLEFLDVSSTASSHKAVTSLANYCNRRLEVLKVNFCKNITVPSLVKLASHCRRLKKLYLYGVNGIRNIDEVKCVKPDMWIEQ